MATRISMERSKLRPAPLPANSLQRPSTAPRHGDPLQSSGQVNDTNKHPENAMSTKPGHLRFVLNDSVAFRYLEEDASTTVLERRQQLSGYECHIVEQWTTSRTHPTIVITTYTGDPSHSIVVSVLSVPMDESAWSPRLRVYFKALNQYHAQRRETPLGIMMVTNLSSFPSSLTIVSVPDGDLTKHRYNFFVNENLKRLGCSGRMGLTLGPPAPATIAKFHQLYKTSDKNEAYQAVIELVKLCQSALMLFDKLEIDYADGLLCDVTERAINDWWSDIGTEQYNIEPHDGILGPTTVAGLLGLLMGARNRLHAANAPVAKDPFDVESMKRGISAFQKQQRLERSRRLDRRTLDRLQYNTQKAADKERWAVPKAVKSTMAELSGKGGDVVMDVVGKRDRASIAEIETVDIDRFAQLAFGGRAKWLWFGRPMKRSKGGDGNERVPEEVQGAPSLSKSLIFKPDEHGGFTWKAGRKSTADGLVTTKLDREREQEYQDFVTPTPGDDLENSDENTAKSAVFKRATRSGFGMVKGAVGFRHHRPKPSTDEPMPMSPVEEVSKSQKRPLMWRSQTSPTSPASSYNSPEYPGSNGRQDSSSAAIGQSERLNAALADRNPDIPERMFVALRQPTVDSLPQSTYETTGQEHGKQRPEPHHIASSTVTAESSVAGSIYHGVDLNETLPTRAGTEGDVSALLRRTISYSQYINMEVQSRSGEHFPRHLSFSLAEDSVLHWQSVTEDEGDPFRAPNVNKLRAQLKDQEHTAREAKHLRALITTLQLETVPWTREQMQTLQEYLGHADETQEKLESMYYPRLQEVQTLQSHATGILRQEREHLEEGAKEIETLAAKLEYEIDALRSKTEDVEAGVVEFEKGVGRVEERVAELEKEGGKGSRGTCVVQ